jgi:site-specific DNA recombinase
MMATDSRVRCAVYTRKSSEEGLEQSSNSLDAQREACEAYILSQRHEGWQVIASKYDDGGFSGGTMERPALKKLLEDVAAKRVDTVVVYKVDRLTRSLADFAKIVEAFDKQGISFVSVTQQFNTTTSMGRLTLNVLLSFAQFEREVTGERIRDKIAASKRKGMWMGGVVPIGYDLQNHQLVLNPAEAEVVKEIYRLYLELGCISKLQGHLEQAGIRSKKRVSKTGGVAGGVAFGRGALYEMLHNRIYLGRIVHKSESYPGQHSAIIDKRCGIRCRPDLQQTFGRRANGRERRRKASSWDFCMTEPAIDLRHRMRIRRANAIAIMSLQSRTMRAETFLFGFRQRRLKNWWLRRLVTCFTRHSESSRH